MNIFKRLEIKRHECFQFVVELFVAVCQAIVNGIAKGFEVAVKLVVQTFFFQKFPVTFDQIQVRRVARKENQLNPQQSGKRPDPVTSLVRCIVQNHLDDEGQVYASSS